MSVKYFGVSFTSLNDVVVYQNGQVSGTLTTLRSLVFFGGIHRVKNLVLVHVNIFGRGGVVIVVEVRWECPPLIPSVPSSPSQCLNSPVQVMSFLQDLKVRFLLNTLTTHFYLLLLFNNRKMRREKSAKVFEYEPQSRNIWTSTAWKSLNSQCLTIHFWWYLKMLHGIFI